MWFGATNVDEIRHTHTHITSPKANKLQPVFVSFTFDLFFSQSVGRLVEVNTEHWTVIYFYFSLCSATFLCAFDLFGFFISIGGTVSIECAESTRRKSNPIHIPGFDFIFVYGVWCVIFYVKLRARSERVLGRYLAIIFCWSGRAFVVRMRESSFLPLLRFHFDYIIITIIIVSFHLHIRCPWYVGRGATFAISIFRRWNHSNESFV